jgi:hypothetical protein
MTPMGTNQLKACPNGKKINFEQIKLQHASNGAHRGGNTLLMAIIFIEGRQQLKRSFRSFFKFVMGKEISFYESSNGLTIHAFDSVFFIDPLVIEGEFYSIFPLWADYLKQTLFPFRLVILNYQKRENLNSNPFSINLVDSNSPLSDKIRTVLSVDDLTVHDFNGNYETTNIIDMLKGFFKGHGEESLVSILTSIGNDLDMGPKLVASDDYSVDECIQELIIKRELPGKWSEFKERYNRYLIYFRYTPFFKEIQGLTDYFQKVDAYLRNIPKTKETFIKTRISEEIRKARKILEDIDSKYIGSEWPVQL